jgi:hypothetical protein
MRRQFVDEALGDDRRLVGGGGGRQIGIRDRQIEPDGQRIDGVNAGDNVEIDPQHRTDVLVEDALEGEDDVRGVEWFAVVEFHPRTQMERPGLQILCRVPACRQVRLNLKLPIQCGQSAEAIVRIIVIDAADAHLLRVERRRLDRESHPEG